MSKRVALIGAGNIGGRIISHLIEGGYEVVVHDPSDAASRRATESGARTEASVSGAARNAAVVLLSLPTPRIVDDVATRILAEDVAGRVVVDHSTVDPATAHRLAKRARSHAARFLDAPVSGGVQAAEAGTLSVMVGEIRQLWRR